MSIAVFQTEKTNMNSYHRKQRQENSEDLDILEFSTKTNWKKIHLCIFFAVHPKLNNNILQGSLQEL